MKTKNFTLTTLVFLFALLFNGPVLKAQSLWSTAFSGGINNAGTIVQMNADGSFTKVYDFTEATGSGPMGSLLQADNGKVYGTCVNGGTDSSCVVFCYDPLTSTYTDIWDFDIVHGDFPMSGLIKGPNGILYGAASAGGASSVSGTTSGSGVIYSVDPTTNTYTDIYDFTGTNGFAPCGSPLLAADGKLYGLTSGILFFYDSTSTFGNIYSYDITTNTYTDLHDFAGIKDGYAFGSLIQHNGLLYGMCSGQPQYAPTQIAYIFNSEIPVLPAINQGNIFSYNPATNTYTDLHDFDSVNGGAPYGSLLLASNGKLYGTTSAGGAYNLGVIFSIDPSTQAYTKLFDFNNTLGATPMGDLVQNTDGKLYGTTNEGGANTYGVSFRFDPATNQYTALASFDYNNGRGPLSGAPAIVSSTVGILSPTKNESISVYPVPAHNSVTVNIESSASENSVITITDINGRNVRGSLIQPANGNSQTKIDISPLESGIYFLKVTSGDNVVTKKIVRE